MNAPDFAMMVSELQEKFTLEYIGAQIGVSGRQVSNIKNGEIPKGITAVRLYTFHGKHGITVHADGITVHSAQENKA